MMSGVETVIPLPCAALHSSADECEALSAQQTSSADVGPSCYPPASAELDTLASAAVAAATTYTTPRRSTGLATVTPGTIGGPPLPDDQAEDDEKQSSQPQTQKNSDEGEGTVEDEGGAIVSASDGTDDASVEEGASSSASNTLSSQRTVSMSSTASSLSETGNPKEAAAATPTVRLGPRMTPRKDTRTLCPPSTCVKEDSGGDGITAIDSSSNLSELKPRNLDGILKNGEGHHHQQQHRAAAPGGPAYSSTLARLPPPTSTFLDGKISPLRSSSRRDESSKAIAHSNGVAFAVAGSTMKREFTPPPPVVSNETSSSVKSSGLWLSPRTPMPPSSEYRVASAKSAGLTPRLTPGLGLTPTNFAIDFGRGHKKEGSMGAVDATNVFAWLQSPGDGLFTPSGGLNSLSAMNTPRGMYGFSATDNAAGGDAPKLAPSPNRHHPHQSYHLYSEVQLEAGGDVGVNTPKVPDCQRSMICISPLASRNKKGQPTAPDTPMSINYSEVFASPRLPTPRLRQTPLHRDGASTSDGRQTSPVVSALHSAERGINLDHDLNALLQLAESTTPGGRPSGMAFMSPLITSGLRRASDAARNVEPPSSLQLPIIKGSSRDKPDTKTGASPPQLSRRTGGSSSSMKSSLKSKSQHKRKANDGEYHDQHHPPGYSHPSMLQYTQPGGHETMPHGGYHYQNHPGYGPHPGYVYPGQPQQHYYAQPQPMHTTASPSPPVKPKSRSRSRSKPKSAANKRKADSVSVALKAPIEIEAPLPKRVRKTVQTTAVGEGSGGRGKSKVTASDPTDKQRIADAIAAVNALYGNGTEKQRKLNEVTLRGVTQRPSRKWQAQLYYAGKSRYIGVFDSKDKASLAYEIAREILKGTDNHNPAPSEVEKNVNLARKASFLGVGIDEPS